MSYHQNIVRLRAVYRALEEMDPEVIFIGGATTSLYVDQPASEIRPTDDVDILVEIFNYKSYDEVLTKLRKKGFTHDQEGRVICRMHVQGIIVDVIPIGQNVLGFTNRWYQEGVKNTILYKLDEDVYIRVFSVPYFLASKIEAFKNRGNNDGRLSTDFEDIVYLMANRTTIWNELNETKEELRFFLQENFASWMSRSYLEEWVASHLGYYEYTKTPVILDEIKKFLDSGKNE